MPGREGKNSNICINIRVSDTGKHLMARLQDHYGLSQSSIIEMMLREEARRLHIRIPGSGADLAEKERQAARTAGSDPPPSKP